MGKLKKNKNIFYRIEEINNLFIFRTFNLVKTVFLLILRYYHGAKRLIIKNYFS